MSALAFPGPSAARRIWPGSGLFVGCQLTSLARRSVPAGSAAAATRISFRAPAVSALTLWGNACRETTVMTPSEIRKRNVNIVLAGIAGHLAVHNSQDRSQDQDDDAGTRDRDPIGDGWGHRRPAASRLCCPL